MYIFIYYTVQNFKEYFEQFEAIQHRDRKSKKIFSFLVSDQLREETHIFFFLVVGPPQEGEGVKPLLPRFFYDLKKKLPELFEKQEKLIKNVINNFCFVSESIIF